MRTDRPRIVLLRQPAGPDPYEAAFEGAGFAVRSVPVLRFESVGRDALADALAQADRFDGLVLTSPRAVEALSVHDLAAWRDKPTFVVGPRTAARARALGLEVRGEEAGSAAALAKAVIAKKVLFVCGDRRRDDLPDRLRAAGGAVEERVVYRTVGDASALDSALAVRPDWLAFFSPSGVEAALELDGISWNSLSTAAIGPTTADALRSAGLDPAAVAAEPTPDALAAAVLYAHRPADV